MSSTEKIIVDSIVPQPENNVLKKTNSPGASKPFRFFFLAFYAFVRTEIRSISVKCILKRVFASRLDFDYYVRAFVFDSALTSQ